MIYKVVEFKFEASKNGICSENFKQGCPTFKITGVMHIPLLQCPRTGHFQAPLGTTEFDVLINIDEDTGFKMIHGGYSPDWSQEWWTTSVVEMTIGTPP